MSGILATSEQILRIILLLKVNEKKKSVINLTAKKLVLLVGSIDLLVSLQHH
jgi:hypothetical protein